jgi:hypothetical protein
MDLTPLTKDCADGRTCPGAFATDRGTIIIRGYTLTSDQLAQVTLGDGETATEIPAALLLEAARAYRE